MNDVPRQERLVSHLLGRPIRLVDVPAQDWQDLLWWATHPECLKSSGKPIGETRLQEIADEFQIEWAEMLGEAARMLDVLMRYRGDDL